MVFTCAPGVDEVTVAVTVQLPLAGMVPPLRLTVPEDEVPVVPPQVVVTAAAVVVTPAGSESVNVAPLNALVFGLVSVIVKVDVPPLLITWGEKALVMAGGRSVIASA